MNLIARFQVNYEIGTITWRMYERSLEIKEKSERDS